MQEHNRDVHKHRDMHPIPSIVINVEDATDGGIGPVNVLLLQGEDVDEDDEEDVDEDVVEDVVLDPYNRQM